MGPAGGIEPALGRAALVEAEAAELPLGAGDFRRGLPGGHHFRRAYLETLELVTCTHQSTDL